MSVCLSVIASAVYGHIRYIDNNTDSWKHISVSWGGVSQAGNPIGSELVWINTDILIEKIKMALVGDINR